MDTDRDDPLGEALLTPRQVARLFNVTPRTVTRWHQQGLLSAQRTLGGHRRFHANEIQKLLAGKPTKTG